MFLPYKVFFQLHFELQDQYWYPEQDLYKKTTQPDTRRQKIYSIRIPVVGNTGKNLSNFF
jgi:hypothetical protein